MDDAVVKKQRKFTKFLKSIFPWKGDPAKEVFRKIVMLIAIITLLVSLGVIGNKLWQGFMNSNLYNDLSDLVNEDEEWAKIKAEFPNVDFPEGMQLKYARLYALNQDMVGWLEIKDSSVSMPIVQADNNSFYLKKDFYKKSTNYGNPFLDYRNNIRELDFNTIIYGHNMKDKQIFGQLLNMYDTVEHYQKYPTIEFNTIFKDYKWKVVGAFYTNAKAKQDLNNYIFPYNNVKMGPVSSEEFIEQLKLRFIYDTNVDFTTEDNLLMLSTCSDVFYEARLVIVARAVRDGEPSKVDVSKVVLNESPRYPQAWYSKYKLKNPYKDADQWHPSFF